MKNFIKCLLKKFANMLKVLDKCKEVQSIPPPPPPPYGGGGGG